MARHKTLMSENINSILRETITLDGKRYRVMRINHVRNGVYKLHLVNKTEDKWVEVLAEKDGTIIFIDA